MTSLPLGAAAAASPGAIAAESQAWALPTIEIGDGSDTPGTGDGIGAARVEAPQPDAPVAFLDVPTDPAAGVHGMVWL
ncbi:MAG TPA: hypothetical protein PLV68_16280, partial [Ilumatobacteraceae bacterium]|nr:hypothetical protein [Ilumatobacteraceae bacterium]